VSSGGVFFNHLSSAVGGDIPKPLSFLHATLHNKSGKKKGNKRLSHENNSGTLNYFPWDILFFSFSFHLFCEVSREGKREEYLHHWTSG
jgi:hypothetical protein